MQTKHLSQTPSHSEEGEREEGHPQENIIAYFQPAPPPKGWLKLGRCLGQREQPSRGTKTQRRNTTQTKNPNKQNKTTNPKGEGRGVSKGQLTRLLLTQPHAPSVQIPRTYNRESEQRTRIKRRLRDRWTANSAENITRTEQEITKRKSSELSEESNGTENIQKGQLSTT